ncbi:cell division cycle-associated protein 7-like [Copidosoma floridanum]|uniref:cell division cycle-associated protein 7-like n=1 Tax=Copidosoma floridanum TaxID=29053 RepID=UPI0006C99994|nr:cell division cycle-associated protein 7-like [Copidosoma floridanum]
MSTRHIPFKTTGTSCQPRSVKFQKILDETEEERNELNQLQEASKEEPKKPKKRRRDRPQGSPKAQKVFIRKYETRYASRPKNNNDEGKDELEAKKYNTRASSRKDDVEVPKDGGFQVVRELKCSFKSFFDSSAEEDEENEEENEADVSLYMPSSERRKKLKSIKTSNADADDDDDEDDDDGNGGKHFTLKEYAEKYQKKKKVYNMSKVTYDPSKIPTPDEITQEMLDCVVLRAGDKDHDPHNGTSCHQCRQKTKDFKTLCRSGRCTGVKGRFCGPCLQGRYGESALEALKDPHWSCPVCRGICNCSICLRHQGKKPTGQMAPTAMKKGFKSVKDYCDAKEKESFCNN